MQSNEAITKSAGARPEEAFHALLLAVAEAAQGQTPAEFLSFCCKAARQYFQASGAYFWVIEPDDELLAIEADGHMAAEFRGTHLTSREAALATEAVRSRQAVFLADVDPQQYPRLGSFGARSALAVPLIVFGQTTGVLVLLHVEQPGFFGPDEAAKTSILAGQMGSLLEASRLDQLSREEHRRSSILLEFARALPSAPDVSAVQEALADRLRNLLRVRVVCVLLRDGPAFRLGAVAAETAQLAAAMRTRWQGAGMDFASDLAARAISAGEPVAAAISAEVHGFKDMLPSGALLAAPLRTSRSVGAVIVFPRVEGSFTAEERALVSAVTGLGAVAVANAELYATAAAQAQELHHLLEISGELSGVANLDQFLERFVVRAADFLGFRRSFIALLDGERCEVRWSAEAGKARRTSFSFAAQAAASVLLHKEVFWTNGGAEQPGHVLHPEIAHYAAEQVLEVPLVGTDGRILGMFGVLEKLDSQEINREDVRRAQSLSAPAAVALELTGNLHSAEEHRRRSEDLMALSLELNSRLRLPEFARSFVVRAADMMSAESAALILLPAAGTHTIAWHKRPSAADKTLERRLQVAIAEAARDRPDAILSGSARSLLGVSLAESLEWDDLTLARLQASDGELVGWLALGNRGGSLRPAEHLLTALASHASVALQNARLFGRMEQANRHWIDIFDAIGDFIVVHDAAENVLRVNRSLADSIGVRPNELVGVSMRALLSMSGAPAYSGCPFCRSSADADGYLHLLNDRSYLVSTSSIHAAQHDELQTIHVLKDVTDRREAERRHRELFDNIQEGLYFSTPDGRFIEVNDAMVRMLGYENREELLQVDIPTQVYYSVAQRQKFSEALEKQGVLRNYEETIRRKDGSPIHTLQNTFAVRDAKGNVTQYRGLLLDITGLKTFQAELQRERDFTNKILNNTQNLILVVDTVGLISYANRRWAEAGYHMNQLLGRDLADLVAAQRRPNLDDALRQVLQGQPVDNLEMPVLRGDGRFGQFSVNLSPMRDEQGKVGSVVVVMTDVTDSAMLQAKLMHTEKMAAVGQLVSGVAHEVNNPLTAILGFADLLLENQELPEVAKKDLRVILQEAQRTKQIVQNLLSFARQMPPQRKQVQLNVILRRTVQLRAYDLHSHGVEVQEQLAGDLPDVVGDAHQLQQVFLNILNNAYDAVRETGRPGRIEIGTASSRGHVEVVFRDNGNGIVFPDRIFDPFFTTKKVGEGTGLGLSICYGIVREHGGEILCHNNVGSPGATFIVRLPLATEVASQGAVAGVAPS